MQVAQLKHADQATVLPRCYTESKQHSSSGHVQLQLQVQNIAVYFLKVICVACGSSRRSLNIYSITALHLAETAQRAA
jgi:hypothetical protein